MSHFLPPSPKSKAEVVEMLYRTFRSCSISSTADMSVETVGTATGSPALFSFFVASCFTSWPPSGVSGGGELGGVESKLSQYSWRKRILWCTILKDYWKYYFHSLMAVQCCKGCDVSGITKQYLFTSQPAKARSFSQEICLRNRRSIILCMHADDAVNPLKCMCVSLQWACNELAETKIR